MPTIKIQFPRSASLKALLLQNYLLLVIGVSFVFMDLLIDQLKIVPAIFFMIILILRAKSITKCLAVLVLAFLIFTFIVNVNGLIGVFDVAQRNYGYFALALILVMYFSFEKFWHLKISVLEDAQALLVSTLSFTLVFKRDLLEKGGAIAAIFPHEDNAAWVLTSNGVNNAARYDQGNYGTFVDLSFLYMGEFARWATPGLNTNDYLALGIVNLQLVVMGLLPFLALAVVGEMSPNKRNFFPILILQVGSILVWLHFITIGHLTAAISSIMLLFTLTWYISRKLSNLPLTIVSQSVAIFTLYQAGSTWFPLVPLSVVIILFLLTQTQDWSHSLSKVLIVLALLAILILTVNELFVRFAFFKTEGQSWFTGAANLIKMEGGVAATGPITISLALLITSALIFVVLSTRIMTATIIIPIVLLWLSAATIRIINVAITQGPANYGVRKFESVILIVVFTICLWLISVLLTEQHFSKIIQSFAVAPIFVLLMQLPVTELFISRGVYTDISEGRNFNVSVSISEHVFRGDSVLCFNGFHQLEVFSELRMLAYTCSRWSAAYSDTDGLIKNEWRKAVLGAIKQEELVDVKNAQEYDSKIIIVGLPEYQKELNPDWLLMINDDWEIIAATD